jgi:hypothetical protein
VQSALANRLFFNTSLVTKHCSVLNKIKWCRSLSGKKWPRFTWAFCDALNQGVFDERGNPALTPHGVYVSTMTSTLTSPTNADSNRTLLLASKQPSCC